VSGIYLINIIKLNKRSHMLGTVPKSNRKSTERAKIDVLKNVLSRAFTTASNLFR
jgi:hypothetical protein